MTPEQVLQMMQLITLALSGVNMTIQEIQKFRELSALSPVVADNLKKLFADSNAADDATIALVDEWKKEHPVD